MPGGADNRELGIRVFHVFVEPKLGVQRGRRATELDCSDSGHSSGTGC